MAMYSDNSGGNARKESLKESAPRELQLPNLLRIAFIVNSGVFMQSELAARATSAFNFSSSAARSVCVTTGSAVGFGKREKYATARAMRAARFSKRFLISPSPSRAGAVMRISPPARTAIVRRRARATLCILYANTPALVFTSFCIDKYSTLFHTSAKKKVRRLATANLVHTRLIERRASNLNTPNLSV